MTYEQLKAALVIISECESFTITEDDKAMIISVFKTILKPLKEMGLVTTVISAQYALLEISTWNNGYFCIVARQMCSLLSPIVDFYHQLFDE